MTTTSVPASVRFQKAVSVLNQYGWIQGEHGTPAQGFCAIGALSQAGASLDSAKDVLQGDLGVARCDISLAEWNDVQSRTKKDVVQLFDAAYILALQEEGIELDEYFA